MLNIGDEVIIKNSGNNYSITKDGSIGIITEVRSHVYVIKFITVCSIKGAEREAEESFTFSIDKLHVALREQLSITEKVCRKIKEMEERRKVPPNYCIIDDVVSTVAYW